MLSPLRVPSPLRVAVQTPPQQSATNDGSGFRETMGERVTLCKRAKLPHGRPLAGGVVKDGRWAATE